MYNKNNVLSVIAMMAGAILAILGVGFATMYVLEGVIATIGEADRSPIFWYLPILFLGFGATVLGLGLLRWGRKRWSGQR